MTALRPELEALPPRMRQLPVSDRGFPIPAFVDTQADGTRDFRFMSQKHWVRCVQDRLCWVCGQPLGGWLAFVVGPMCLINMTTSEPPSHRDCAEWSARNCPFLARPHARRREDELTDAMKENAAGCPILRNPGCAAVIMTREYRIFRDDKNAPLITIGTPHEVTWWAEGRKATADEVEESIRTGLPNLEALARQERGGMEALAQARQKAERWLP